MPIKTLIKHLILDTAINNTMDKITSSMQIKNKLDGLKVGNRFRKVVYHDHYPFRTNSYYLHDCRINEICGERIIISCEYHESYVKIGSRPRAELEVNKEWTKHIIYLQNIESME